MIPDLLFLTHLTSQNRGRGSLKIRLTVRYRFCYTLDMLIAKRIISRMKMPANPTQPTHRR